MKTKGVWVIMMIMFVLIVSDYNVLSVQIESKDVSDALGCSGKCTLECSPLAVFPTLYLICARDCCRKCCKKQNNVVECTSHCPNISTGM
ncbi:hypothetical protein VIGAN_03286400 [Vigna angularis var. angularis]|uniref:Uncharacterized protein n=1 Tax=Vigna angularis var. angularis TaxID=157739 RepID=A0A0S3RQE5_PHAAN|nr:hypothetical protein VIGAN_03286400 [Vigna angularis var. angularis]